MPWPPGVETTAMSSDPSLYFHSHFLIMEDTTHDRVRYEARQHTDGSHWFVDRVEADGGYTVASDLDEEDAVRIAAALAACEGIPTGQLERGLSSPSLTNVDGPLFRDQRKLL